MDDWDLLIRICWQVFGDTDCSDKHCGGTDLVMRISVIWILGITALVARI